MYPTVFDPEKQGSGVRWSIRATPLIVVKVDYVKKCIFHVKIKIFYFSSDRAYFGPVGFLILKSIILICKFAQIASINAILGSISALYAFFIG